MKCPAPTCNKSLSYTEVCRRCDVPADQQHFVQLLECTCTAPLPALPFLLSDVGVGRELSARNG